MAHNEYLDKIHLKFDELPEELCKFISIWLYNNDDVDYYDLNLHTYWNDMYASLKVLLLDVYEESSIALLSGVRKDSMNESFSNIFRKYRLGMWLEREK